MRRSTAGPLRCGYAATATFRSAGPPAKQGSYARLEGQLRSFEAIPTPRVVVFQDLDSPPVGATFGELMCGAYKSFGCAGLITSGAGRDLQQVRAMGFPVFTGGTICSHGYVQVIDTNVPVHVGGVTVYPGDLIHGDGNGGDGARARLPHADRGRGGARDSPRPRGSSSTSRRPAAATSRVSRSRSMRTRGRSMSFAAKRTPALAEDQNNPEGACTTGSSSSMPVEIRSMPANQAC
jgi:hypothetical protein